MDEKNQQQQSKSIADIEKEQHARKMESREARDAERESVKPRNPEKEQPASDAHDNGPGEVHAPARVEADSMANQPETAPTNDGGTPKDAA